MDSEVKGVFRAAFVAIVVCAAIALLRSPAMSQCPQWDATQIYSIKQSNNIVVKVGLNQRGPRLSGNAFFQESPVRSTEPSLRPFRETRSRWK